MKFKNQRYEFSDFLKIGKRPKTFEETYKIVENKVSGLYESEARSVWDTLHHKDEIKSIVEVGRNLGGSLFLFTCMFPNLQKVLSIDIGEFEPTDSALKDFLKINNISFEFIKMDSTQYKAEGFWDFVFIDGGHTAEIVREDINIWKKRCKYIGFHDFANLGKKNKHKRVFKGVIDEINAAWLENDWKQIGERRRSEIIFETGLGD